MVSVSRAKNDRINILFLLCIFMNRNNPLHCSKEYSFRKEENLTSFICDCKQIHPPLPGIFILNANKFIHCDSKQDARSVRGNDLHEDDVIYRRKIFWDCFRQDTIFIFNQSAASGISTTMFSKTIESFK